MSFNLRPVAQTVILRFGMRAYFILYILLVLSFGSTSVRTQEREKIDPKAEEAAAALYFERKYVEAGNAFRALATIYERNLGAEHPKTLGIRGLMALALLNQGKPQDAEKGFKKIWRPGNYDATRAQNVRERIEASLAKEKTDPKDKP